MEVCFDPDFEDDIVEEEDTDEVPGAEGSGNFPSGFVLSVFPCSATVVFCFPEGSDERNDDGYVSLFICSFFIERYNVFENILIRTCFHL